VSIFDSLVVRHPHSPPPTTSLFPFHYLLSSFISIFPPIRMPSASFFAVVAALAGSTLAAPSSQAADAYTTIPSSYAAPASSQPPVYGDPSDASASSSAPAWGGVSSAPGSSQPPVYGVSSSSAAVSSAYGSPSSYSSSSSYAESYSYSSHVASSSFPSSSATYSYSSHVASSSFAASSGYGSQSSYGISSSSGAGYWSSSSTYPYPSVIVDIFSSSSAQWSSSYPTPSTIIDVIPGYPSNSPSWNPPHGDNPPKSPSQNPPHHNPGQSPSWNPPNNDPPKSPSTNPPNTYPNGPSGGCPGPTGQYCMSEEDAEQAADIFRELIQNYSDELALAALTEDFVDYSSAVAIIINGGKFFPLKIEDTY
jgi:hypothetical protein